MSQHGVDSNLRTGRNQMTFRFLLTKKLFDSMVVIIEFATATNA